MVGKNTHRLVTLMSATLTIVGSVIAYKLTESLSTSQSLGIVLVWVAAGIIVTYLLSRLQARSQEESPEAIKERVSQLEPELRKQVQARSYGARRQLIEAPLRELDLDITPRVGWVRDPRLVEPEAHSEKVADGIVAAFEYSKRRMLIVGEPGSGKTMAAYSLIEVLDETEGDERIPLLVNLSAWEAQETFEAFLVDYLCSSVGYEVHERAVASAFISAGRHSLILDGLDEIPAELRQHFSERLDEFVRGLPSEVGVVVTCRTQEYEELLDAHSTGLGLVQAVEILPLSSEQLDSAFVELAKRDKEWETFLSQRDHTAYQRVRDLLSNPLFLNLAVVGRLSPSQLLDWSTTEQELRDLVLESYLDRTLANQRQYEPEDARRYLTWIARFLNGDEVSPFGLKETDFTVFDLADLTPPDPPTRYWLFGALAVGLSLGLVFGPVLTLVEMLGFGGLDVGLGLGVGLVLALVVGLVFGLVFGLGLALVLALGFGLRTGQHFKRSAVSSRLTLVWPSTRRQLLDFLRRAGRGLVYGLGLGLVFGLVLAPILALGYGLGFGLVYGMADGLGFGLLLGLVLALGYGLLETRSVLIPSRTPKEARSRSLIAALTWLICGLLGGLVGRLSWDLVFGGPVEELALRLYGETVPLKLVEELHRDPTGSVLVGLVEGLVLGLVVGLVVGMRNGGWFVLLQKVAHRRLARAGNLPPNAYDFLEWGIETQIFRRVGGGVRFRHNLIQQHLANTPEGAA
jgi:MFS family permease